jgi:anti-anti-sigma factor
MADTASDPGELVAIEKRGGYTWVMLPDTITVHNYSDVEAAIMRRCAGTGGHVVFDLSRMHTMYSSALGILIRIRKELGEKGGVVCLVNVSRTILKLFGSLNLDKLFPIYLTDVEFEISQDEVWRQRLSERKIEFLFIAQVEKGVYRISLSGEMLTGYDLTLCREFKPNPKIALYILDLTALTAVDSNGAGVVIGMLEKISDQTGRCRAYGANKAVKQVLQFLGAGRHVTFCKKEKDALTGTEL